MQMRERKRLHDLTKWRAKEREGTPYDCSQKELEEYREHTRPNRHPTIDGYVVYETKPYFLYTSSWCRLSVHARLAHDMSCKG